VSIIKHTATYLNIWLIPFPVPAWPTSYDTAIANKTTPAVRACMEAVHAVLLRDFTFYNSITPMAFFDQLKENYGGPYPRELINLPKEMISFYQKTEGIPESINNLRDAQHKQLTWSKLPMSNKQLLAIASTAVLATQCFLCVMDKWEALLPALKT
jgi:hypothetical protein